jgi:alpha-amylase/alpha-mannosidase (GH57 family)
MVKMLEGFPEIRQTINLVPSLLEQLTDYAAHNATDVYLEISRKSPSDLTEAERTFVIENFFLANWDTMIKPFPRYHELLARRGARYTRDDLARLLRSFTDSDIRDLQVLFNLAWIDPMFRNSDPFLGDLARKGKGFTEEEKHLLLASQLEILRKIIPQYRKMQEVGSVEVSVSPFYHPILPLLWNTDSARIAMPEATLPSKRFSYPEDAVQQIRMGIAYYEETFGRRPAGMWPSEGSVSEEVVRAIGAEGISWVATDEEVLARSLGRPLRSPEGYLTDPHALYRPHRFGGVSMFFRDHKLSDLIGFDYCRMHPEKAAEDLIGRLIQIKYGLPHDRAHVVPIILDGENAWEFYPNDGHDFLQALYRRLGGDGRFKTVTFSDFIREHGPGEDLHRLHAGSWIYGNFAIWIGHEEDNLAWDYLTQTREDLAAFTQAHPDRDMSDAWKALYAAEGSDWNWWYGDDHVTETREEFDELFRGYLMKVYHVMGRDMPQFLYMPIQQRDRAITPTVPPRGFITPRIDGRVTSFFEWHQGARIDVGSSGGSMHRAESLISSVYFGFNAENLYLRADPIRPFPDMEEDIVLHVHILQPRRFTITLPA